ncbi:Thermostable beta-glucosidase B [Tritrichomonas foetus]|uniref:beta-glucosidase n=1 Tax=Tritrichomonas foetus TaxID=1144522 RepID=A0A1J4JE96_9EUKA|nr:Thermostable beta-glucosidase B [Tritrichomonas foetus]|eukprot:OHS97432.1 Thermostable beta-glucosidase B [Tritrichomonas foetus]
MSFEVKSIVSQLTLEEKVNLCGGIDMWHTASVERLGVPNIMMSDGPHGLRKQTVSEGIININDSIDAVCFPAACATSCSFDKDILRKMGQTLADEMIATDISILLGPDVNIKRSPLCGRNFEYFSEDPFLSTTLSGSLIEGIQSKGVGACIKHFAVNNQEHRRLSVSANVDERALREIYLASFEGAIRNAKPWAIMCSYNRVNGVYASDNEQLLNQILRKEWGYEGFVMSDWGAVNDRVAGLKAGLDLQMPGPCKWSIPVVIKAIKDGLLDEKYVDICAERVLNMVSKAHHTFKNLTGEKGCFDLEKHHIIARKVEEECIVLLKNENNVLPLKKTQKIAFIGGFAKTPRYQGSGSSHINASKVTNAYDSSKVIVGESTGSIEYAEGFRTDIQKEENENEQQIDREKIDQAINLAKSSEVIVIFAGLPDAYESEGYDRAHINMPSNQNILIEEIAKVNNNVIVILHNGSPIAMPWASSVSGILECFLGGQAVGEATANILFGITNPSGHLSETYPLRLEDNPSYLEFPGHDNEVNYLESIFVGYRYYEKKHMNVLFPFGHGLSYTTFKYNNLSINKSEFKDNDENIVVSVDVENTGSVAGKTVAQLYVSDHTNIINRPVKELKGFEKVYLEPGEKKTIQFKLCKRSFAYWNTKIHDWHAESGKYEIHIGQSSQQIEASLAVNVVSSSKIVRHIDMNSTLSEILQIQAIKDFLKSEIAKLPELKGALESSDSFIRILASESPLRSLAFLLPNRDQVENIIKHSNKLIDDAVNSE